MKSITVTELDHIVLNVRDIDASLAFYTGVLGLKAERVQEFKEGKIGFPSVRINGDTIIDLFPLKNASARQAGAGQAAGNLNHFCLVVEKEDFSGIVDYLKGHSVAILRGPISRWGARGRATSVYFHDPDENEVEIRCY
ncbi:MAG: VOC family protein [Deltaproteobacteria bacterium]|nr:VOC family protein [Deltaproteobacteria bacterium]MBI2210076.1 VOC family protein [Deltaproteobacteria bacterium]MBI2349397.1 VOC family protein [Deltaproteobacteria bacterium]MBI2538550.1 VOC family protein [Deltaproteobacteria bacterium]MBI2991656.1 VOC family protein [Deltaproteobacteria bacterium]